MFSPLFLERPDSVPGSRNVTRLAVHPGNIALYTCPRAVLGRKALGSFKEDKVIDCYLQQITHKLLLG